MNDVIMFRMLNLIDKKASIGTLFKLGYAYSSIVKWYFELEAAGYIAEKDEEYKILTVEGKKKLKELKRKTKYTEIGTLEQYRIKKKSVEEVYLP